MRADWVLECLTDKQLDGFIDVLELRIIRACKQFCIGLYETELLEIPYMERKLNNLLEEYGPCKGWHSKLVKESTPHLFVFDLLDKNNELLTSIRFKYEYGVYRL
jgi:hypothetical protein